MTHDALTGSDWEATIGRLGGRLELEREARETARPRKVKCGVDQLRLTLAYCLGLVGLRLTAAIAPVLDLATLTAAAPRLARNLCEPRRQRSYQAIALLS